MEALGSADWILGTYEAAFTRLVLKLEASRFTAGVT